MSTKKPTSKHHKKKTQKNLKVEKKVFFLFLELYLFIKQSEANLAKIGYVTFQDRQDNIINTHYRCDLIVATSLFRDFAK